MLDKLDPSAFLFMNILVGVCCVILGVISDALMGDSGLTRFGNVATLALGAFGSIYGLDYLYQQNYISGHNLTLETWIIAPPLAACGLLILLSLLKLGLRVLFRR